MKKKNIPQRKPIWNNKGIFLLDKALSSKSETGFLQLKVWKSNFEGQNTMILLQLVRG